VHPAAPLGAGAEDTLDYFNVYFPYADDRLTLRLTDAPEDRPIAAEFLVRDIDSTWFLEEQGRSPLRDRLLPMSPVGPVGISRDRIRIGVGLTPGTYEFRYKVDRRRHGYWLVLESATVRLELFKVSSEIDNIERSFVEAPIKRYQAERIAQLKRQYAELVSKP
jgi:hypothetical protein